MGHNNPRQKIQYHLRLKQELEEMRHECMLLLRERFHLEQCVRYLAVRSHFPVPGKGKPVAQGGADSRSPLEKNPVQPASLRRHHLYATPVSRRSLMLAGRGKQALQEGQAWQSKVLSMCAARSFIHACLKSCGHSHTHRLSDSLNHSPSLLFVRSFVCSFDRSLIVRQDKVLIKYIQPLAFTSG